MTELRARLSALDALNTDLEQQYKDAESHLPDIAALPPDPQEFLFDGYSAEQDQIHAAHMQSDSAAQRAKGVRSSVDELHTHTGEEKTYLADCEKATAENRHEAAKLEEVLRTWKGVAVRADLTTEQCERQMHRAKDLDAGAEAVCLRWSEAGQGAEAVERMTLEIERLEIDLVKMKAEREKFATKASAIKKQFTMWADFNKRMQAAGKACELMQKATTSPEKKAGKKWLDKVRAKNVS
jgi:chromosome segregation ATPase